MAAPKVIRPVPVPPMVVSLPSVMGLFKVTSDPERVKAPFPPIPVPFKVSVDALAKVALLKFTFNAPALTVIFPLVPNPFVLVTLKVPALIVVPPV